MQRILIYVDFNSISQLLTYPLHKFKFLFLSYHITEKNAPFSSVWRYMCFFVQLKNRSLAIKL